MANGRDKIPDTESAMNLDKIYNGTVEEMFDSLNENFETIGKPQAIDTVSIKDGAITENKIGDGAITTGKINDGAITEDKIDGGAVTLTKISNDLKNWVLDKAHPVGSFYWSVNGTNPGDATVLGIGVWTQIKDTFILAAGDTYTAGTSGGEARHQLTVTEIPSHSHSLQANGSFTIGNGQGSGASGIPSNTSGWGTIANADWYTLSNGYTGGSQSHNNMPPYITAYCWRRTN